MTETPSEHSQLTFNDIHQQELFEIKQRRKKHSYEVAESDELHPDLVGIALSGGGIRSATFCLGFLQELQRLRVLRIFDYLSTVSGGGYVGGWWSAWLSRREEDVSLEPSFDADHIKDVVSLLKRIAEAPDPVAQDLREHLRSNARGRRLLEVVRRNDLPQLAPRLPEPLAEELKAYIDKGETNELKWRRKTALIDTFPCELRDIFPPKEQIEPERAKNRDVRLKESDGSRCAWKDPIHHLRLFANYLTPRKGILSADTWRAISVVSRNLILTWLILLPLLGGVMLLGQAYLLLHPASEKAFTCVGPQCVETTPLQTVLLVLLAPIVVLLVSSAVMAIAWLLCNRDNSSPLDWIIQWACLFALAALLTSAVFAILPVRNAFASYFHLPEALSYFFSGPWSTPVPEDFVPYVRRLRFAIGWVVGLFVSVLVIWHWDWKGREFADGDVRAANLNSWKREVRRARFGRAQATLLVTTAIVAVVLLLSWLTCLLTREGRITLGVKIPFTLVSVLSAIGGSIFTAMRATPKPAVDGTAPKEPSWASRFVFAVTPPLVVGVLAVVAAALVHSLLLSLYNSTSGYQNSIYALLHVAAVLLIALCMGLAIYELEYVQWSKIFKFSLPSAVFIGLALIDVSWGAQAFLHYGYTNPKGPWVYLLVTSVCFAVLITALVLSRVIRSENWNLGRHFGVGATLFGALTTVGFVIGLLIYFNSAEKVYLNTAERTAGRISGALVLTLMALAGGVILFRVLVHRTKENRLELRLLGSNNFRKRAEALWLAASFCLTLPIVVICLGHYLKWHGQGHLEVPWKETLTLFPVTVGLLLLSLMVLRSLVIQKRLLEENQPMVGWSGGIFEWLFDRILKGSEHRRRGYHFSAVGAICLVSLLDTVVRGFASSESLATIGFGPVNWKLMAAAFTVSLPVFGVSIFQIPIEAEKYEKFKRPLPRLIYSKGFLWLLATLCTGLALMAGLLLPTWLKHVAEIPLNTGLTPILLPVAAACFLIVLFEFQCGERDNRRSILLAALAYLGVASIFFLQLAEASLNWHLVLGLLAAICVWVGALGWMVDPNAVSMHQFYKARLVNAYLGASNLNRYKLGNKEITETVAGDDLPLKSLINCERGGPYHLINTTLNLVAGRDLATAQRSASSFVLSRRYCGSARTNYCFTDEYMNGQLTLGTAVATSGAAVSPSMGAKKPTAALAMLMTLLNVRLGYWAPTPNRKGWNSAQPRLWPFYLVKEFLSQTNDLSDYCYLTDGGHFDNTGLYSLIERGCRFVVLVDCGADPTPACFQDLGEAIRRCRIDFGAEINLNLDPLIKGECPVTRSCFAVGTIKYSEGHLQCLAQNGQANGHGRGNSAQHVDPAQHVGIIVYFKPSVIANVPADVRQYEFENKFFPQQPTTNQWFGEAQFESYRRLGQACAYSAFDPKKSRIDLEEQGKISMKKIEALFTGLHARGHNG